MQISPKLIPNEPHMDPKLLPKLLQIDPELEMSKWQLTPQMVKWRRIRNDNSVIIK